MNYKFITLFIPWHTAWLHLPSDFAARCETLLSTSTY